MSQPRAKFLYKYEEEPFSVRRKEFWPLAESGKVLDSLIPKLCHEADGLILQVCSACMHAPAAAPEACALYPLLLLSPSQHSCNCRLQRGMYRLIKS